MPGFPSRVLFKAVARIPRVDALKIDGDLSDWTDIPALPALAELDGTDSFARIHVAWSDAGLYVAEYCDKPVGTVSVNRRSPLAGDGLQLWIDTRGTQTTHRATRFCHHFVLLPKGGGLGRQEPLAWQGNIRRARERAPLCEPSEIRLASRVGPDHYTLEAFLAAGILNGFEPRAGLRMGFNYMAHDVPGGRQLWSTPPGFPADWDPSLWGLLELADG